MDGTVAWSPMPALGSARRIAALRRRTGLDIVVAARIAAPLDRRWLIAYGASCVVVVLATEGVGWPSDGFMAAARTALTVVVGTLVAAFVSSARLPLSLGAGFGLLATDGREVVVVRQTILGRVGAEAGRRAIGRVCVEPGTRSVLGRRVHVTWDEHTMELDSESPWNSGNAALQAMLTRPAGWYPDPSFSLRLRWHDGTWWTSWVSAPLPGTPPEFPAMATSA